MCTDFENLLTDFTAAVEAGDGTALAALFAPEGVYHDTFYGAFRGREAIAEMLEDRFWGDAERFYWDMHEPVFDAATGFGYARWVFSYSSTMEDSAGKRVVFGGMSQFAVSDGLIGQYREVFSAGIAFAQLQMSPDRSMKILRRMAETHAEDPEWQRHLRTSK